MNLFHSVSFRLFILSASILGALALTAGLLQNVVRHEDQVKRQDLEQQHRLQLFHAVEHRLSAVRLGHSNLASAALSGDSSWRDQAERELAVADAQLEQALDGIMPFAADATSAIRRGLARLGPQLADAVAAMRANRPGDAERLLRSARDGVLGMERHLSEAESQEWAAADIIRSREHNASKESLRLARFCTILTVALGLLLALTVARSLVRPLRRVVAAVRDVADGERAVALPAERSDEFGDISEALRQFRDQAEKLRTMAYRDPLTGLANRARLEESLHSGIVRCARGSTSLALLFLDLDNFKSVNDSLGHSAGDRFLRDAARRIERLTPEGALIARYSGDKFTVLVEGLKRDGSQHVRVKATAAALLRGMAEPYQSNGEFLYMTASIGIAVYPMDGHSAEQIVSSADAAMYLAKRFGRNNVQFASPDLTEDARRKLVVAGEIRRGLAMGEFEPYYQPIVDVGTGRIAGAEALLRWHHPQRGIVLPGEFIRIAEEAGLIGDLGERCLTLAYDQAARWSRTDRPLPIAVNLSARQLQDQKIVAVMQQLQSAQALRPNCLEFEITESVVMERPELSQQTLQEIRRRGHKIGIDDFGTGHSALGYLHRFPIDRIKIDRTFVERVETSRPSRAIISATLALAENLGLDVVAEGVENLTQLQQMKALGCALQQGYYFTPALPADEFEAWLAARR